jgi:hypothetical protein
MGGSPKTPDVPQPQTTAQSMSDYITNYPRLFELQQQYAPQEAAMNVALTQQYAEPMAAALKSAQDTLYPTETAITEKAGTTALAGMDSEMPSWMKDKYLSDLRANLGTTVGSGIAADYTSRGLLEQQKGWNDYYTNMGLSLAGKQPVYGAQQTGYTNQLGGYTAQGVANTNASNYGNMVGAFSNMYGTNSQTAQAGNPYFNSIMGAAGMGLGGFMGK